MVEESEIKDFYDKSAEHRYEKRGNIDQVVNEYVDMLDAFISYLLGKRVLDVGCGVGRDQRYMTSEGLECIGIDISKGQLEFSNRGYSFQMDMSRIGFKKDSFSGVWCPNAIFFQDMDDAQNTVNEFCRCLDKNGICALGFKIGNETSVSEMNRHGDNVEYMMYSKSDAFNLLSGTKLSQFDTFENRVGDRTFLTIFAEM